MLAKTIRDNAITHALLAILLSLAAVSAISADKTKAPRIQVNIIPLLQAKRSQSPIPVAIQFINSTSNIIEGKLLLDVNTDSMFSRFRVSTNELVLPEGTSTKLMFLPPIFESYAKSISVKETIILPSGKKLSLGSQQIPLWFGGETFHFVLMEITDISGKLAENNIASALRLEKLAPLSDNQVNAPRTGSTGISSVSVEKIIPSPFFFCACDIAIANLSALDALDSNQLDALATWIKGGGALLIIPKHDTPTPTTLAFLNELANADPKFENIFATTQNGEILTPVPQDENAAFLRPELGRVALLRNGLQPTEKDFETKWWRAISAFLWRVRRDRLTNIIEHQRWLPKDKEESTPNNKTGATASFFSQPERTVVERFENPKDPSLSTLGYGSSDIESTISSDPYAFLPAQFKVISLWEITLILLAFIAIIGPGEYYILGKLKRRKLTWITFPVTCALFAFLTAKLARSGIDIYHVGGISCIEIGHDGKTIRKEEYKVILTGTTKTISTQYENEMTFPYCMKFAPGLQVNYDGKQISFSNEKQNPSMKGRLFSRYTRSAEFEEWLPHIIPTLAFQDTSESKTEWKFPDTPPEKQTELNAFAKRVNACTEKGFKFIAAGLYRGPPKEDDSHRMTTLSGRYQSNHNNILEVFMSPLESCAQYSKNQGLFAILSAISPTMGPNSAQLRVFDRSAPDETMMLVMLYNDTTRKMKIYRRIYR